MSEKTSLKKLLSIDHGEQLNTWTHAAATIFAAFACGLLLYLAASKYDSWRFFSFSVYALTTIGLYFVSTLYHGSRGRKKRILRKLDHIGIYLKIAGNYTPFAILVLRGNIGWGILGAVWTLAVFGTLWELFRNPRKRTVSFALYGTMSVTALPVLKQLMDSIPPFGFALILLGFLSYAIGVYFFIQDTRIKHGHGLWHLCVMGGTAFQYLCVLLYLT